MTHLTNPEKRALLARVKTLLATLISGVAEDYEANDRCPQCFSRSVAVALVGEAVFHLAEASRFVPDNAEAIDELVGIFRAALTVEFDRVAAEELDAPHEPTDWVH